jgi:hypothetical protein
MANTSNISSALTTDFSVSPYYDDYKANTEYYRLLFKPGYAVQARELTQIQSMLQSQIYRFGRNIFKEGSIVLPGAFTFRMNVGEKKGNPVDYVKIKNDDGFGNIINVSSWMGETIVGNTSNIKATVINVLDSDGTTTNTKTLYISYLSASPSNSAQRVFIAGETLYNSNTGPSIVLNNDPVANTGYASQFTIDEGVFFAKDHFISFPKQSIILSRYNPNPTAKVGFYVTEDIINSSMDSSLLDPAQEASNYSAPGADRLRLTPNLEVVPYSANTDANFVTLFTVENGVVQISNEKSQYNILGDAMAKRTSDESGDYVIKGLNVQLQEHDIVTTPVNNFGRYTNGDNTLMIAAVDAGYGYCKGYAVNNNDKFQITVPKPLEYKNATSQITSTTMGQYVQVNEFVGSWIADQGSRVYFYDSVNQRVTNGGLSYNQKWSSAAQTGNNIGSGIVNAVEYVSGTKGYDAIYNVYLSDITMNGSNNFSTVRSLYYNNASVADMGADILGANNITTNTSILALGQAPLLYYVGSNYTKSVRDQLNNPSTIYYFSRTAGVSSSLYTGTTGNCTITVTGPTNEELPYGTVSAMSDTDVIQDLQMTFNSSVNIGPLWTGATVTSSGGGTTLTGVGTFFTRMNVGDKIELSGLSNTYYITAITSDTVITVNDAVPASVSTASVFKAYKTGDTINLTGKGLRSGTKRKVAATPTSLVINLQEDFPSQMPVTVTYKLVSTDSVEATKTLNPKRYVKINCATAGTTGPFNLGFSDVYQVRAVIKKTGSAPTSYTDGTDVSKYFTVDNGQRDTEYDLASITPGPGLTLTASDYLLVYLDYFSPDYSGKSGYFSINSYNIQDDTDLATEETIRTENVPVYLSPVTNLKYDLRNQLDFRPVKAITAADSTSVAGATTNPTASTTYNFLASGLHFPVPSTELIYDYSYYLGRKDIVTINKDGTISLVKGISSDFPIVPVPTDNQMTLAILTMTPYPSLSPAYANALGRKDLACGVDRASVRGYTMRDIGILENRIKNLEYYTSLTLLEKSALNMKIVNAEGLDRFKNGIFIDTFKDTSLTAKGVDPDFRIVMDPIELAMRPLFSTDSINYDFISGTGVKNSNNKITMAYTNVLQFTQPRVTDFRNLERGTYLYEGTLTVSPQQDVWVDTTQAADEVVSITASAVSGTVPTGIDPLTGQPLSGTNTSWGGALISITDSESADKIANYTKNYLNTTWEGWKATITGYNLYRNTGGTKQLIGTYTASKYGSASAAEAAAKQQAASWTTQPAPGHANDPWNAKAGDSATLETVFNNTRLGTNWFANYSSDVASGPNKLISSSTIPYIRAQELVCKATGMKPYSFLNVFFDGVNMTSKNLVTPLTADQYPTALAKNPLQLGTIAAAGSNLIVNPDGTVYFILKIPADVPKFRTGQRSILVMDGSQVNPQDPLDETDASTLASAYFFADGTKQTLQRTVYSTAGYVKSGEATSESNTTYANNVLPNTFTPPPKPKTGHCCFNPEAKVLMADLTWKAICEIEEGDKVIGDNGHVNTVLRNNKVNVGDRKMIQFDGHDFYTTDDHLFLTKKGWKTWDPQHVLNDKNTTNKDFLIGENRTTPINADDLLKMFDLVDGNLVDKFIPIQFKAHDFDPDYAVYDLNTDGNKTYIVEGFVAHNCCVAYTYLVKAPQDEEGIFCTGYDVFVQRKSATRGMWFEIREMDAAGQITDMTIPGTEVHLDNPDVKVSTDGINNPTEVRFPAPVFLFNNKPYAFVVHSFDPGGLAVDPDTAIWISRLGETDINTGEKVNQRQKLGDFFQTTNNKQWDTIPDVDLRIDIYRAKFNTGTTTFTIGNHPVEKFILANVSSSLSTRIGDHFITGDLLTVTGANGTFAVGDIIRGVTSGNAANGSVVSIPGTNQYAMSNTRYTIGEQVSAYYASNGNYKGISATVSAIANSTAVLTYYNETSAAIYSEFVVSTGGFANNLVIQSVRDSGYNYRATIESVGKFNYSTVSFEPNVLDFVKTAISYEMDTLNDGSTSFSGYEIIHPSETFYFPQEKVIYGKTKEVTTGVGRSNKVRVTFESNSEYVSPLLDLDSTHTIYIDNLINANTDGETGQSGGQALNKYISQTITLADGQDAEDIVVYLTAYRPPGTDVKVYIKMLNSQDSDPISRKNWIELEKQAAGDGVYSSVANRDNYKEFTFAPSTATKSGEMGQVQYTSGDTTYTGYKYFAVKIVLTATNPAVVPRVADLRAIALQM